MKLVSILFRLWFFAYVMMGCTTPILAAHQKSPNKAKTYSQAKKSGRKSSSTKIYESAGQKFRVETLAEFDDVIWGFDFLSDERMIFTGRDTGTVAILELKTGQMTKLTGVPQIETPSQGGMLDVRVYSPGSSNAQIYLAYTPKLTSNSVGTALGVATLSGNQLKDFRQIFSVNPGVRNGNQFGSRIEFDGQNHIFLTVGDHGARDLAQDLGSHIGKILRLNMDGTAAADNPFANTPGAKKEIWALGIRSPDGLTIHPTTGELWETEMGPKGGDELNVIKPGANYGWPVICWGLEYSGEPVGAGIHEKEGMEQPITYWLWTPQKHNLTPAGIAFYSGDAFPKWKGNAFVGTLATSRLQRLVLQGHKVVGQEELLNDLDLRFRNVRMGPDGYLYFSTDSGLIARIVPVN